MRNMLLEDQGRVPDGLRYHLLDIWLDELVGTFDHQAEVPVEKVMEVIAHVRKEGRTKVLRERAREVEEDERLSNLNCQRTRGGRKLDEGVEITSEADDEWEGLED